MQPSTAAGPQQLFHEGETALQKNQLEIAERSFRSVLALDPQSAGAYANLGVIYMRRRQWPQALEMLHKGERLAPQVPGIRLNTGLVYYRQNDFRSAIVPFESVVHDVPDSYQARHLLGCAISLLSAMPTPPACLNRSGRRHRASSIIFTF
jgi:Flp pilus assembly protein TadD